MIVEDLYILYIVLFICLYNNKVNKLKGKFVVGFKQLCLVKFMNSSDKNYVVLDDGFVLYMVGVLVSNVKINWVYDG